jgi:hypothetical protein
MQSPICYHRRRQSFVLNSPLLNILVDPTVLIRWSTTKVTHVSPMLLLQPEPRAVFVVERYVWRRLML